MMQTRYIEGYFESKNNVVFLRRESLVNHYMFLMLKGSKLLLFFVKSDRNIQMYCEIYI